MMNNTIFRAILRLFPLPLFVFASGWAQGASAAGVGIPRELRQKIATARAEWKRGGGAEFKSGLTYIKGVPVIMLVTTKGEPDDKAKRRRRELVSACEFLLEEGAFDRARICVVEADAQNPGNQTTTHYEVLRGNFHQAVKNAARTGATKEGVRKARGDDAVLAAVCATLGIK